MKILVLGSEGFIGSNLVKYFNAKKQTVFAADVVPLTRLNYYQLEININLVDKIFQQTDIDICINASGQSNVQYSFQNPELDYELNTENVKRILQSIQKYQPDCKFINFSSAAVYGNAVGEKLSESDLCHPVSPYGKHKLEAEQICFQLSQQFKIKTCNLRLFSVYGVPQQKLIFWDLWNKYKLQPDRIELFGSGEEVRDFIEIEDVAEAVNIIIEKADFAGEFINIGNGEGVSIREAVSLFFNEIGPNINFVFSHHHKLGDPDKLIADNCKLMSLGYRKKYTLQEGLKKYVAWLKEKK